MPYPNLIQPDTRTQELGDRIQLLEKRSRLRCKSISCRPARRWRGTQRLAALVALAIAGTIVVLSLAGQGSAAPKPGFLPGTWIGKGTIKGNVVDGPMSTHFSGGIAFTMKVSPKLAVSGSGTWQMSMLGSQDGPSEWAVDSTMNGTAPIRLAGSSTAPTFTGTQKVTGEIRSGSMKTPISMERPLTGKLTINRAGKCLVRGVTQMQRGVTLTWSAQLKGSGKCNA